MAERFLVVDHLKLAYEGLFNSDELFNIASAFFYEKGYDWYEKLNLRQVTPTGKQIRIVLEPWKNITDFYKIIISVKMNMTDVREVEVEQDGQALKLNQGQVHIIFDAYILADRNDVWSKKPWHWFVSIISQKYFFKDHFAKAETWVKSDLEDLHGRLKRYLNVFKYTYTE